MTLTKQTAKDGQLLTSYLLGTLSDAERDALEERYFGDTTFFEQMLVTEDELIADYNAGRLSQDQKRLFEQNYLQTQEKRDRVRLVSGLQFDSSPIHARRAEVHESWWQKFLSLFSPQHPTARLAFGFASLAIVLGGVWIVYQNQAMRSRIRNQEEIEASLRAETQELEQRLGQTGSRNEQLARDLRNSESERRELEQQLSQPSSKPPAIPYFDFSGSIGPGGVGTASGQVKPWSMVIPAGAKFVQVAVPVSRTFQSYRLSLRDRNDNELWRRPDLTSRRAGQRFVVNTLIPTTAVKDGEFTLVLLGEAEGGATEFIAEYLVKVELKR
ncbi:MAG TPA: hypothetical protein VIB00_13095 [Pyrinomonadaceae bacterium]|jgi:hypothetical protein